MIEEWRSLEAFGFSNYSVSDLGRVRNDKFWRVLSGSPNTNGFIKVAMTNDTGYRVTMSTTPLVAHCFVDGYSEIFNTPIHKNGNKLHNYADNLAWRPRWFAVKYHRQFKDQKNWLTVPVVETHTEEIFDDVRDAIVKYGILGTDITLSVMSHRPVFPTGQEFRVFE